MAAFEITRKTKSEMLLFSFLSVKNTRKNVFLVSLSVSLNRFHSGVLIVDFEQVNEGWIPH